MTPEALRDAMARAICREKPNRRGRPFEDNPWRAESECEADAALSAIKASGWMVVPVEPTEKMLDAAVTADRPPKANVVQSILAEYRAMLASSPMGG